MQGLIIGSGVSVLLMLAWVHLGLGALLFPPAATPPRMVAAAGPYTVTLYADSKQFVIGDGNSVTMDVRDRAGHQVADAVVHLHADMLIMAMPVPDATAMARSGGRYTARLLFTMAGTWQLTISVAAPGEGTARVAFEVGVRWS